MGSELYRVAVDGHSAGASVEPDTPTIELAFCMTSGAAQKRTNAREHLLKMEGLGDIVIGAGIKSLDLVAPAVPRGQHEDRHGAACAPPRFQNRNAVHLGQSDIQNDGVVGLGLAEKMPFLTIESPVDHVTRIGECSHQLPVEIRIILDNEEAQGRGPPLTRVSAKNRTLPVTVPVHSDPRKGQKAGAAIERAAYRPFLSLALASPERAIKFAPSNGTAAVSEDVILETEDLTKEFAGFVAVNGVNLRVARGSIHALIGPNGAGKTTCFNLLTKFLRPTRGRIIYKGHDITTAPPAAVARLGVGRSFQISATFPHLTVLENVRIALQRQRGGSFDFWRSKNVLDAFNERAVALITDVGLASYARSTAVELPYGRKRALEIATTLALDPEILLLDEPMAGMGHEDIDRISALIKSVGANRTVLMVEHNLSVVANLSDRITVLTRGRILAEGNYQTVSADPSVREAYLGVGHA